MHGSWASYPAHDGDKYFIANGAPDTTDVVWQMAGLTISADGGLEYQFEAYVASAFATSPPQLSYDIFG